LVTLLDRRSKQPTAEAMINMLDKQPCHTLTLDNGVEFADHRVIAKRANINIYFADYYASWQRGSNENANGRLRRFIPRSMDLSTLSAQKLRRIVERLNKQPRKCLDWKSPYELYNNVSVALIV